MIELLNMDCMDYLREQPDKSFDLAIVDPPYGKDPQYKKDKYKKITWNDAIPEPDYFKELKRISNNQIIWGSNNYPRIGNGQLVWNKLGPDIGRRNTAKHFSDCEIAYQSFNNLIKMISYTYIGNVQGNGYQVDWTSSKIHPCQKPVGLYERIMKMYAEPGQRILDTHGGSFSSAIAAHYFGCDFVGIELDEDYYTAACKRFDAETRQVAMF